MKLIIEVDENDLKRLLGMDMAKTIELLDLFRMFLEEKGGLASADGFLERARKRGEEEE